jgi:hypothetical protein
LLVGFVSSCGLPPVSIPGPEPGTAQRVVCSRLMAALPARVGDQQRRDVEPADVLAAAWGDPPILLRCGVTKPPGLTPFSRCDSVNGVGWFTRRTSAGYEFTTIGRQAHVQVGVPAVYVPAANALVDLASALKRTVPVVAPCV